MTVEFYYCVGTSYATAEMAKAGDLEITEPGPGDSALVAGLNGMTRRWGGGPPQDPFTGFLDRTMFSAKKVFYPAAQQNMGLSIDTGIQNVINLVKVLPKGQKWAVGGYSQGAAVMAGVMLETKSGGALDSKAADFIGGTMFGNPRRAVNYRGSVGGTWSGAFDIPGSTTGGHGSFPATGPYRRLQPTECDPLKWIEFAHPDDIITSVGDSPQGLAWSAGNDVFLNTADPFEWAAYLALSIPIAALSLATMAFADNALTFTDAAGKTFTWLKGLGHTAYPFMPPVGNPDGNLTSYQIALKFLTEKANESAVAPVVVPPTTTAGWSTTLLPPAA